MRDRLIGLMKEAETKVQETLKSKFQLDLTEWLSIYADHLIANGVIVLPCKVGDITYIFDYEVNNHLETKYKGITPSSVEAITIDDEGIWVENEHAKYHISAFGDIIFLTKEEAEQALKGGADE